MTGTTSTIGRKSPLPLPRTPAKIMPNQALTPLSNNTVHGYMKATKASVARRSGPGGRPSLTPSTFLSPENSPESVSSLSPKTPEDPSQMQENKSAPDIEMTPLPPTQRSYSPSSESDCSSEASSKYWMIKVVHASWTHLISQAKTLLLTTSKQWKLHSARITPTGT